MPRRRYPPDEIMHQLRGVDVLFSQGYRIAGG